MVYWKTLLRNRESGASGQDNNVFHVMSFPCTRDTMRDESFKLTLCDSRRQKSFHVLSDRVKIMLHMAMDAVHQGDLHPELLCFPFAAGGWQDTQDEQDRSRYFSDFPLALSRLKTVYHWNMCIVCIVWTIGHSPARTPLGRGWLYIQAIYKHNLRPKQATWTPL